MNWTKIPETSPLKKQKTARRQQLSDKELQARARKDTNVHINSAMLDAFDNGDIFWNVTEKMENDLYQARLAALRAENKVGFWTA